MITKTTFENALHDAMRQKNEVAKNTYKLLLSSIKMVEIDKGIILDESGIISILQKEIKMRKESIVDFEKGNRNDLIRTAESEIEILNSFLPSQIDDEALVLLVKDAILEVDAKSVSDMGKVMKILIPRLSGKASSDRISATVRSLL
ncbi:MAG: GatB/YqeY domain-containing protein [Chloroflexi bacterium]|nr:GatB/YqeY domain-containing protein [Chloroflexota bacterium]